MLSFPFTQITYYQKTMKYFDILKKLEKAGIETKYVIILILVKNIFLQIIGLHLFNKLLLSACYNHRLNTL